MKPGKFLRLLVDDLLLFAQQSHCVLRFTQLCWRQAPRFEDEVAKVGVENHLAPQVLFAGLSKGIKTDFPQTVVKGKAIWPEPRISLRAEKQRLEPKRVYLVLDQRLAGSIAHVHQVEVRLVDGNHEQRLFISRRGNGDETATKRVAG